MGKKPFYVTTPIYYVNDVPHIGHAYTTIAADTVARYKAATGHDVYFLTGTDEHGRKIEQAAQAGGETPIELADRVVVKFQDLWKVLGISNTDFIRTTEPRHYDAVAEIWRLVAERNGDIYLDEYEGWYDVRNEAFITETQLEEIMKLPEASRPHLEKIKEESYFFKLSRIPGTSSASLQRAPRVHKARLQKKRGRKFRRGRAQGLKRKQNELLMGNSCSRRRGTCDLRMVRRSHELHDISWVS